MKQSQTLPLLVSGDENQRTNWRDRAIENLKIHEFGWNPVRYLIAEKQVDSGFRQLIVGVAMPNTDYNPSNVLRLADLVDELRANGDQRYKLEIKNKYAMVTGFYIGSSAAGEDLLSDTSAVMLLALMYEKDKDVLKNMNLPEFKHAEEGFKALCELDSKSNLIQNCLNYFRKN